MATNEISESDGIALVINQIRVHREGVLVILDVGRLSNETTIGLFDDLVDFQVLMTLASTDEHITCHSHRYQDDSPDCHESDHSTQYNFSRTHGLGNDRINRLALDVGRQ